MKHSLKPMKLVHTIGAISIASTTLLAASVTDALAQQPGSATYQTRVADQAQPLVPGDAIRLSFWREPEYSGDYIVDERGLAVLPLLGQQKITGIPPATLKQRLLQEYGEQLRNQEVQIILLRRVRILGAVQNPGLFHVDPTMTLGDAVALAGGATPQGKLDGIRVFRGGFEIRSDLDTSAPVIDAIRSGDQIIVPERSWLSRNAAVIIGGTISAVGIIVAAAAF